MVFSLLDATLQRRFPGMKSGRNNSGSVPTNVVPVYFEIIYSCLRLVVIQELNFGILGNDLKAIVYFLECELMVWLSVYFGDSA